MTNTLHTSPYTQLEPYTKVEPVLLLEPGSELDGAQASLGRALLDWYVGVRRALPWRATRDPYYIWVSEIMLQQTQVATVIGFYERWIKRFPSVEALALAEEHDVLRAWEGLGYYSRARNLQRAARQIVALHGGRLPHQLEELRRLPGIGPYSAGAIASIAFGSDEPAVDGNIIRVLTRLFSLAGDPKRAPLQGRIWALARALIPRGRAGDFNQALMELGATCCTPRAPRCSACPVARHCKALSQDRVLDFPETAPRRALTEERRVAAVVRRRGRVLVARAPSTAARWAGMWQFPDVELGSEADPVVSLQAGVEQTTGIIVDVGPKMGQLRHHVTRFRIDIDVYGCRARAGRARAIAYGAVSWCAPEQLPALPMPAAHRKIAQSML
jgi:A/G-specific adenine glycosylase